MICLGNRPKKAVLVLFAAMVPIVTPIPATPQFAYWFDLRQEELVYRPDVAAIRGELEHLYAVLPGLERLGLSVYVVRQTGRFGERHLLGLYDPAANSVYVYSLTATRLWYIPFLETCWQAALAHEVGHAVWYRAFTEAERQGYMRLTKSNNPVENFAEDFRVLFGSGAAKSAWGWRRRDPAPEVAELILRVLGGGMSEVNETTPQHPGT